MKTCRVCGIEKNDGDFYKTAGRLCKHCQSIEAKKYKQTDKRDIPKICSKCGEEKDGKSFHKRSNICNSCERIRKKLWYENMSPEEKARQEVKEKEKWQRAKEREKINPALREKRENAKTEWIKKNSETYLWRLAKSRATKKNIPFDIDIEDIVIPTHCPVLGIPLSITGDNYNSPSLDKIDPLKGYTKGNIMVISFRANDLKSNSTIEELRMLYEYYVVSGKFIF